MPPGCLTANSSEMLERLVAAGYLASADDVTLLVTAWPSDQVPDTLACREAEVDLPLRNGSLGAMLERSTQIGPQNAADMPLFVPAGVLAEIAEAARRATPLEIGGVLIGHLHCAEEGFFTEITAAVPAIEAVSSETELRFTPDAWAAVRAAVDLRRSDELILSWYHSHAVRSAAFGKCAQCPPEKQRQCPVATALFSRQDRFLHKTVYLRAFSTALVANDLADGVVFSCFGWRDAVVAQRGFHQIERGESQSCGSTK
jgi:proteasome lid subunit RPN8/RPN11